MKKIGFIGSGVMGCAMASNLMKAEFFLQRKKELISLI